MINLEMLRDAVGYLLESKFDIGVHANMKIE